LGELEFDSDKTEAKFQAQKVLIDEHGKGME
jgi:hypothetical protein